MKRRSLSFLALGLVGFLASCESEPTCSDGLKNGSEGDVDCGLSCGTPCGDAMGCTAAGDCKSGVCAAGVCAAPSCTDGIKNGTEVGTDCAGSCANKCSDNTACVQAADCQSGVCTNGSCEAPTCTDTVKNGTEGDVDCGGSCSTLCADGATCSIGTDCTSLVCSGGICAVPTCTDTAKNAKETDVDCGGGTCGPCDDLKSCGLPGDCKSNVCMSNTCVASSCNDTVKNGTETDIDCGGASCLKCADLKTCGQGTDCQSKICTANKCAVPTCTDVTMNGKETDVDCGGGTCAKCIDTKACAVAADCVSGVCTANKCAVPTCTDTVKNGVETDVDCGGTCATKCAVTKACNVDGDCTSNTCFNKVCVNTPTFTAVTPNMGPTTGSAVTLNGTGFFPVGMAATSVTFGGVAGTVPNVTAATTATTTTPARLNMIGLVNVVLTLPGNHVYTLNNGFKYYYGQLAFNNAVASGSNLTTQYSGMVLVDFDKDGDLDIVAIRPATTSVEVLRNNGAGVFTGGVGVSVGFTPTRIATADFNGDTLPDVAVTGPNSVAVLRGDGVSSFNVGASFIVPVVGTVRGIAAVDVDGVNRADLLVANTTNNRVDLLRNNGLGTAFTVVAGYAAGLTGAYELASADFNKDGRPDFVVTSSSAALAYHCRNNAGTSYVCASVAAPAALASVTTGDVNSDTNPDFVLATNGNTQVLSYSGNGAFAFTQKATNGLATNWSDLKLVDIDKDGYQDIVYASSAGLGSVGVCRGDNTGGFLAATGIRSLNSPPSQVVVGQFNTGTDQKDDFAAGTNLGVHVSLSNVQ